MCVAQRGVRDEQALFLFGPRRKFLWPELFQKLASPFWRIDTGNFWQRCIFDRFGRLLASYFWIAVQNDVANIREKFRRSITAPGKAKKFRMLFEKSGGDFAAAEFRMIHNVFKERNIRFHAANAKFPERAVHALASFGKI